MTFFLSLGILRQSAKWRNSAWTPPSKKSLTRRLSSIIPRAVAEMALKPLCAICPFQRAWQLHTFDDDTVDVHPVRAVFRRGIGKKRWLSITQKWSIRWSRQQFATGDSEVGCSTQLLLHGYSPHRSILPSSAFISSRMMHGPIIALLGAKHSACNYSPSLVTPHPNRRMLLLSLTSIMPFGKFHSR